MIVAVAAAAAAHAVNSKQQRRRVVYGLCIATAVESSELATSGDCAVVANGRYHVFGIALSLVFIIIIIIILYSRGARVRAGRRPGEPDR